MSKLTRRSLLRAGAASGVALTLSQSEGKAQPFPSSFIYPKNPDDRLRLDEGEERRVLIVGGGIAGLSAALELAERGYQVTVREADEVFGGRLATRSVETNEGAFQVEHGLHMWFDNYHVFRDIRERLGINKWFREYEGVHFTFRDYEDEVLVSEPPIYPLNLINLLARSPNFNLFSAFRQLGLLGPIAFYKHDEVWDRFDDVTFAEWGKQNVSKKFYDIILQPAASVTLNDPEKISAAEMILFMHFFFMGQPRAMNREVTTIDHGSAVIDPWVAYLEELGVTLRLSDPVPGLRFKGERVVGTTDEAEDYDAVILASEVGGTQRILEGSMGEDDLGTALKDALKVGVDGLKTAPPYKVARVWFDRPVNEGRPDILETPQHPPINLAVQFHLLEEESKEWAARSGGSCLEFHLYSQPAFSGMSDEETMDFFMPTALELFPELREAEVLDYYIGSYHNFTSFEVGQGQRRPWSDTPRVLGIENLSFAGDWVRTDYPSALMERAVCTGREAANQILLDDRVRQAELEVTSSYGPGLI